MNSSRLLGGMQELAFRCHRCGAASKLLDGEVVSRRDECSSCGADMRCCLNCRHFDPSKNNQCAESEADWLADKESANFCDWFKPSDTAFDPLRKSDADAAQDALAALFGDDN